MTRSFNAGISRNRAPDRTAPFFLAPALLLRSHRDSKPSQETRLKMNHSFVPSILFHVLLTFLSKFFSTFLRSTSPLSVFVSYLDLEEIYLPLYEEVPISATLRLKEIRALSKRLYRAFTFYGGWFHIT